VLYVPIASKLFVILFVLRRIRHEFHLARYRIRAKLTVFELDRSHLFADVDSLFVFAVDAGRCVIPRLQHVDPLIEGFVGSLRWPVVFLPACPVEVLLLRKICRPTLIPFVSAALRKALVVEVRQALLLT